MAFLSEKNGDYAACLKYSVRIFVKNIFKMHRLEVSGAVQPLRAFILYVYISFKFPHQNPV
jgi:hypothetical protein